MKLKNIVWCAIVALSLLIAAPAHAQDGWGDPSNCFQAFYYPGQHVGITTRVHYYESGTDRWYWNEGWEYVDNAGAANYWYSDAKDNYNVSCEGDDYVDWGGWNMADYVWFHRPITHTEVAQPYTFYGYRAADGPGSSGVCNHFGVEEAWFYEYPNTPWYELSWNGQYGPIASNWQAVQIWGGQGSYNVYAVTCGSTAPGTYYTQYTYKTFIFGTFWGATTWFNWYDWTSYPEHDY